MNSAGAARLEALAIRVHFQGVKAIDGVDLAVEQGEILGLIGPNGAGKTTLVNVLTGFQHPTTGTVAVNGRDITTWGPAAIARAGLARTFQAPDYGTEEGRDGRPCRRSGDVGGGDARVREGSDPLARLRCRLPVEPAVRVTVGAVGLRPPARREDHARPQPASGTGPGAPDRQPRHQPGRAWRLGRPVRRGGGRRRASVASGAAPALRSDRHGPARRRDEHPVQCDPAIYNQPVSLFPHTAAEFDQLTAWAGALGESCLRLTGPLLGHVDTGSVARDMEQLRRALHDGKLNFLGLSYGSHLGSTYAELYPHRIRAMALDGIANHSTTINTLFAQTALAYEDSFDRFAAWCGRTASCALHGRDAAAMFDDLVARADRQPIPAPDCQVGVCRPSVTGGELRMNAFSGLLWKDGVPAIGQPGWHELASALLRAEQGDASAFAVHLPQSPPDDPLQGLAINCIDYPWDALTYEDFAAKALLGRVLAPHTQGAAEGWLGMLGCMRWPVPLARPHHTVTVRGAPPILLVGSTHDPSTPYVFAHEMHDHIAGSVLLTRDGDSHTSSWLGGGRTRDAIARYLITLQTPPANTVYPD